MSGFGGVVQPEEWDDEGADWTDFAACKGNRETDERGESIFFAPPANKYRVRKEEVYARARAICATCPVREPCLEYALSVREASDFGCWAGTDEAERRQIRKARRERG